MKITPPPMPEPAREAEGACASWRNASPDYFTADQLAARDAQWQRIVEEAVAAEREACAALAVEMAAADAKKYEDDPTPVKQPYANNRLMHVGWNAAAAIRARAKDQASTNSADEHC